jgi:hypothetical protein
MDKKATNNGKKGGWLVGKRHYAKNGKPLGGIKAVVTDAGGKPVELEGGEVIINREASKKHWKELSRINQSAGNGVAIEPPSDEFDEDPEDNYENGGKIDFNPNRVPSKMIVNYAKKIKDKHPEIWRLGGNIFGNEAFENLLRVSNRGYWLDSEEWMYIKWRAYVARHAKDFRIEGVIAMLKWCDKVDKGWAYMKQLIEEKIEKIDSKKSWKHKTSKMKGGGSVDDVFTTSKDLVLYHYTDGDEPIISTKAKRMIPMSLSASNSSKWSAWGKNKFEIILPKNTKILKVDNKTFWNYGKETDTPINRGKEIYKKAKAKNVDVIFLDKIAWQPIEYCILNNNFTFKKIMKDGGRTISQTPAPLKDRISGSKFNEKGSASTSSKANDIKFDESTIKSIQRLIDEHNEEHPSKKITLSVAKAVVRRGMGAYSSSHRPTITGGKPNSRTAWGLARLKAFIYKAQTGKSKSGKYSQDNDLFEELGISVQKMANGGLIAPNGNPSNLTPEQYKLVRTPAFKKWFGDWESDPANASKVVDENGEPLVMYHGTDVEFYEFKKIKKNGWDVFWFTPSFETAKMYSESNSNNGIVLECFLNVKNPSKKYPFDLKEYDGFIDSDNEMDYVNWKSVKHITIVQVVSSNQIKLADGTNTTFDGSNSDIRYKDGGFIPASGTLVTKDKTNKLDYKKVGDNYEVVISDGEPNKFDSHTKIQYKKRKGKSLMNYNQFVDYLYSDGYINDKMKDGGKVEKGASESYNILMQHLDEYCQYHFNEHLDKDSFMIKTIKNGDGHKVQEVSGTTKSGRDVHISIDQLYMKNGGSVDAKDTVTLDIPLLIRTLELAREDIKSDAELHEMVERLLDLKNKPELTMDDYTYIADIEHKHLKPKMELGGNIEIEKLIAKAHDNLTRKRGRKEYAPTSHELQEEIDRMIMEDQFGSNNI